MLLGEVNAAFRSGSRRPGVLGIAILVRLLLAEWVKLICEGLKLSLVRIDGSIVLGDSSSRMVVAWIGRLY